MHKLGDFLSGEFILRGRANSGGVVLLRALWTSTLVFLAAIALRSRLADGATWVPSFAALRQLLHDHLPWLGTIFAASYAAFYSRFASQWTYLAGLYNQIMATEAQCPAGDSDDRARTYAAWWAGFIEDAEDVHLALKPSYAAIIAGLLGDAEVRAAFKANTIDGGSRLSELEAQLKRTLGADKFEQLQRDRPRLFTSTVVPPPAPGIPPVKLTP